MKTSFTRSRESVVQILPIEASIVGMRPLCTIAALFVASARATSTRMSASATAWRAKASSRSSGRSSLMCPTMSSTVFSSGR